MYPKPSRSPFRDSETQQYPDNSNLFTKALKHKPSRQFELGVPGCQQVLPASNGTKVIKQSPLSPLGKGLAISKIDYTCDQQLPAKNDADCSLLCRQVLLANDNSLFCNQVLRVAPAEKLDAKVRPGRPEDAQATEYQKIIDKTASILKAYEQNMRELETQNRRLAQRLSTYERLPIKYN